MQRLPDGDLQDEGVNFGMVIGDVWQKDWGRCGEVARVQGGDWRVRESKKEGSCSDIANLNQV